ncbi:MAG: hypothetical protein KIT60_07045 [Burkholderiaceae bacterium]|nr:hypothetical protein [Burkholderiaceae bacterium]
MRLFAALLASTFALAANGEAQLLPAGEFAARDGRPGPGKRWRVTDEQGRRIAATLSATAAITPVVIDYEHQTLLAKSNGQAAPAAGWIRGAAWRPGEGLFANVEWTAAAKARIDAGEYRYISPVITFDEDGTVTSVQLAALVNHPALLGMEPVVAQLATQFSSLQEEKASMTLLASLIAALGLPADTPEATALTAVTTLSAAPNKTKMAEALAGALGLQPSVDQTTALAAISALRRSRDAMIDALGLQRDVDQATALAAIATMKGSGDDARTQLAMLQAEVVALKTRETERELQVLLDDAIAQHKITPAQRESLATIGKTQLAWLKGHLQGLKPIPGLEGQSGGAERGAEGNGGATPEAQAKDLAQRARAYQAEQLKGGIEVTTAQAVAHVAALKS